MKFIVQIVLCLLLTTASIAQENYYVLFEYNKAEVPDTAMAYLIKTIYTKNVVKVYLEGHCDSIGSREYNYDLSRRRVNAVQQLLIENGFDIKKISGKVGFGKDKPRTANSSPAARQQNRRVLVRFKFGTPIEQTPKLVTKAKEVVVNKTPKKKVANTPPPPSKEKTVQEQEVPVEHPIELKRENFKPNALIALPNLLFQGGRHFLMSNSTASLDTLVKIMKEKSDLRIEIQGHVCCTTYHIDGYDWDTKTDNLSVNRAIAIKQYLIEQGIDAQRMQTRGFGGSRKLFPLEENRYQIAQNRRVEIKVLP